MRVAFSYGGYYLIFLLFLLWAVVCFRVVSNFRTSARAFVKKYSLGFVFCLAMCAAIFASSPPAFRVLSDETNLAAVSKSMTYEKRTDNVTMGYWYYDNFKPLRRTTPKRPLAFPFLTHIFHTFLGYSPTNAFAANFFVLFSLLFLIFALIKNAFGNTWAFASVFLLAAQPVLVQTATSGGFDLMSALFMVISFACLKGFLNDRASGARFQLLWVSLLMLANVRYEGIMFFAITMGLLAVFGYIRKEFFRKRAGVLYLSASSAFLLFLWQRLLVKNQFEGVQNAFSIEFFVRNNLTFFKYLFDFSFTKPFATVVNILGIFALLYFSVALISRRLVLSGPSARLAAISGACLLANWVLVTSYHMTVDHPTAVRFFVIFYAVLSLFALFLARGVQLFSRKPAYVLVFSVLVFMLYHPLSVEGRFSRTMTLPRKYRFTIDFLKKESKKERNFLVIDNRPGQYTIWDYGAVNFEFANKDKSVISGYENHLYENIFVVQDIEYETHKPTKDTYLKGSFELETLKEAQNNSRRFTRISRVVRN